MSREVIGDAPAWGVAERAAERVVENERLRAQARLATVLRASRQALLPMADVLPPHDATDAAAEEPLAPAPPEPRRARERDRRRLPAIAAAVAMALVVTGWTAYAVTSPPSDPARGVVAAVTGATAASTVEPSRRALLAIMIANPGKQSVAVAGYAFTTRSSGALGLDQPTAHVGAGERVEITVDVALDCTKPAPLVLPDLVIEERDGGRREVAAVGSVAALTTICASGPPEGQPVTLVGARRDGDDLVVTVNVPSNRATEIRAVRATGVALDAGKLPVRADRRPHDLRLKAPATCPTAWRDDGMPASLDLDLDSGGPAVLFLTVGKPLTAWALDVVCRGVA